MSARRTLFAASAATVLCCGAAPAGAVVVTLNSVRDNTLYQDATGSVSNGAGVYMFAGRTQFAGVRRALVRFDVAGALGGGARVNSAALTLTATQNRELPAEIALHRAAADWGEGASDAGLPGGRGAPAAAGDATWIHRAFGTTDLWSTPGGDFAPDASASEIVSLAGVYTWQSTAPLVADVQAWASAPAGNFGWLIRGGNEDEPVSAKRFATREDPEPENRPRLVIDYTVGGDATLDNRVNLADFNVLAANFGQSGRTFEQGDFNLDTVVNLADFNILASNFGFDANTPTTAPPEWGPTSGFVPEPAALPVVAVLAATMARHPQARSRRRAKHGNIDAG